jgi:hypothetical protein
VKHGAQLRGQPVEVHPTDSVQGSREAVFTERKSHLSGGDLNSYLRLCSDKG